MNKSLLDRLVCVFLAASLTACATSATKPPNPLVVARMHAVDRAHMATVVISTRVEETSSTEREERWSSVVEG